MSATKLDGPFVRPDGLAFTNLPPGGTGVESKVPPKRNAEALQAQGLAGPALPTFVSAVLQEGLSFVSGIGREDTTSSWRAGGKAKSQSGSSAPVEPYQNNIPKQGSAPAAEWFARRSCHKNAATSGTAACNEFVEQFHRRHAESERDFTPTVIACRTAIEWKYDGEDLTIDERTWTDIRVRVVEMKHKLPPPLQKRVFAVTQVSALARDGYECIIVTTPLKEFADCKFAELAREKGVTIAMYAAVERIRIRPDKGDIEWVMATTSNVKGVMPTTVQNLFVGDAILKDVGQLTTVVDCQTTAVYSISILACSAKVASISEYTATVNDTVSS